MARKSYTAEQRAEAVDLYREHGAAEAARRTGITAGSIRSWASRSGVATERREELEAGIAAAAVSHEARRATLAEKMLLIAESAADQELTMIEHAKLRDVVGARTRAIHDHQLLTGAATGRTEHTAGKEAAHAVADELEERRKKKSA